MLRKSSRALILMAGCSLIGMASAAFAQTVAPSTGQEDDPVPGSTAIQEIVVTAQKRSEALQNVPIAVSSFSEEALKSSGVTTAADLRTQIPNVAFSRGPTNSVNFQIRGIGAKLTTATSDGGVGVHINNAPLTVSRIADTDFYDIERVEVLRGPQGTLYGRNSTGGVVNIITAKPKRDFSASASAEVANYGALKFRGHVNIPIAPALSLRVAGFYLTREGYSLNTVTGNDADDRNLWAMRGTLAFEPMDNFRAFLMWEHFRESDHRMKSAKGLCTPDAGAASIGGVPVNNPIARGFLSQGCTNGSLYSPAALGAPNSIGTVAGIVGITTGVASGNTNAGARQDPNLRRFASTIDPKYRARTDLVELNLELELSDSLTLSSLTSYNKDYSFSSQDADSYMPTGSYNSTVFTPGGFLADPQFGQTAFDESYQRVVNSNRQWTEELRLQSNFDGPINFNIGGIYIDYRVVQDFIYPSTAFTIRSLQLNQAGTGIYIDPNRQPDTTGHNYLVNRTPYHLRGLAGFGELYWRVADNFKLTAGLRYTDDKKSADIVPVTLFTPGRGLTTTGVQKANFKEVTGRFNAEWTPQISFTDHTLLYGSYSRGYKGGGFNPNSSVTIGGVNATFAPEFINAFEVGIKNTLVGGSLQFNVTGFHYDYVDYQVAKIVALTVANENVDATIKGLEFETIWQPIRGFRLNGSLGLLDTAIGDGSTSIDLLNRTQGDASLTQIKNGNGTNCVVNTSALAGVVAGINAGFIPPAALLGACTGGLAARGVVASQGNPVNLKGKNLPESPPWTLSIGAEYRFDLSDDWTITARGDYYKQASSFARIYNAEVDRLKGWDNVNISLIAASPANGLNVQLFARNLLNKTIIVASSLNDELSGLTSQVYVNEPRTYGINITKSF